MVLQREDLVFTSRVPIVVFLVLEKSGSIKLAPLLPNSLVPGELTRGNHRAACLSCDSWGYMVPMEEAMKIKVLLSGSQVFILSVFYWVSAFICIPCSHHYACCRAVSACSFAQQLYLKYSTSLLRRKYCGRILVLSLKRMVHLIARCELI